MGQAAGPCTVPGQAAAASSGAPVEQPPAAAADGHDEVEKLKAFLRAKSTAGQLEKAKMTIRQAARAGSCRPEHAERALREFGRAGEGHAAGGGPAAGAGAAPEISPLAVGGRQWLVLSEAAWLQAPRPDSPRLGSFAPGRVLTELQADRAPSEWVPVLPRGWVLRRALRPAGEGEAAAADLGRQPAAVPSQPRPAAATAPVRGPQAGVPEHGGPQEARGAKRPLAHEEGGSVPRSTRPRHTGKGCDEVYVLDALNILRHRNDMQPSRGSDLDWLQLRLAGGYFKERGKRVYAFLRRSQAWDRTGPGYRGLVQTLGEECVVPCPAGADDDSFMITFVRDLEGESNGKALGERPGCSAVQSPVLAWIVTNDLFRDHHQVVNRQWVQQHTVKYAFAAGRFVPGAPGARWA
ncbi:unnamed protein product [Prorocentrum cordatum]|uniref:Uncharacterized protein n=1 Tax=Prorocentrum cordatum TaxID=2364126 RepID=A0ABN9VXT2_9DINO|nr:unnamed protein product [Polarella glacialis]